MSKEIEVHGANAVSPVGSFYQDHETRVAIVDNSDYARLKNYRWTGAVCREGVLPTHHSGRAGGLGRMSHAITGAKMGQVVEYINGNTLDNRRSNIRVRATPPKLPGVRVPRDGTSRFQARLRLGTVLGKERRISLGCYSTPEEAYEAYLRACAMYCPEKLTGSYGYWLGDFTEKELGL